MSEPAVDYSIEREWDVVGACVEHGDGLREAVADLHDYLKDIVAGMEEMSAPTAVAPTQQRKALEALVALDQAQDMLDATDMFLEAALNALGYAR